MADPTNLSEIDLTPIPGKTYFNLEREWREEFIYFALIDRFHDDQVRTPVLQPGRSNGISLQPVPFVSAKTALISVPEGNEHIRRDQVGDAISIYVSGSDREPAG
jgi:hypothetical protein